MDTETLTLDNLFAGEVSPAIEITIGASQDIVCGDLLELSETPVANTSTGAITVTEGSLFVRPPAKASIFGVYVVAGEDVKTGASESAKILAHPRGEFNEAAMRFGGSSTADQNRFVLAKQGIILCKTIPA